MHNYKKTLVTTLIVLMITAMIIPAAMAADQTQSPTESQSTQNFTHADYAYADGGTYADATSPTQNATYWGYDFTIPTGSTIQGITVRLDAWDILGSGSNQIGYLSVELSNDGGSTWTNIKSTGTLTQSQATYYLGSTSDTWGTSWTVAQINSDNFRVRVTAEKTSGNVNNWLLDWIPITVTYTVESTNDPPTAAFSWSPTTPDEGTLVTFTDESTDTDGTIVAWSWDFGDGSATSSLQNPTHTYADNDVYTVSLTVTDDDGASDTVSHDITVNNVAPIVGAISILPADVVKIGSTITASSSFSDPGVNDYPWVISWNFGDGSTPATSNTNTQGSVSTTHTYTATGVYVVTLTVTDKDGDSGTSEYKYVVIYDPNGGFVTGGGSINSPAGAYYADTSLAGKATFGFVSKYLKGANTPTGNTEFQFQAGNLNFKSTSYDWLVVAGSKAMYKGVGTINGAGNYGFMLSAIDGGTGKNAGPDLFRIQIWDTDNGNAIVYDNMYGQDALENPATTVTGSIVVH